MSDFTQALLQFGELVANPQTVLLIIKFTFLLGIIFCIRFLLRGQSAALRHAVLGMGLVAVPLLLVCHFCAPPWAIPGAEFAMDRLTNQFAQPEQVATHASSDFSQNRPPMAMLEGLGGGSEFDHDNPFLQESESKTELAGEQQSNLAESGNLPKTGDLDSAAIFSWKHLLFLTWLAGVIAFLVRISLAWTIVSRRVARAKHLRLADGADGLPRAVTRLVEQIRNADIRIKFSESTSQMPLGFGLFRKTILLPASCFTWTADQWRIVLLHEYAHFERGDCWTNLLARIHQSLFWFHPFSSLLVTQIRTESEMACDDLVIRKGVSQTDYADMLFQVAAQSRTSNNTLIATVAMSDAVPLESRVQSILSNDTVRRPVNAMALIGLSLAIILTSVPLATAQFGVAIPTDDSPALIDQDSPKKSDDVPDIVKQAPTVVLQLNAGQTLEGNSSFELELETAFGGASFKSHLIRSIKSLQDNKGRFTIESVDGSSLVGKIKNEAITLNSDAGEQIIKIADIKELTLIQNARLVAGKITDGSAMNLTTYHIRVPENYEPEKEYPAIVILHGSNTNSKRYVSTIVSEWPAIANKYILIGINGENRNKKSDADDPKFNYTYVNFAGKSKYSGFPGTDRESPALVSEVISEIRNFVPISKLFVGGHSQGGFLTYSLLMNYPEMIDGAFPMAGGVIIQCEPTAYTDEEIRKLQRETPLVIIHAKNDKVIEHSYSSYAFNGFLDDGFPMIRLIDETQAGHDFGLLPIEDAIHWLELMSSDDHAEMVKSLAGLAEKGRVRDAVALLNRLEQMRVDAHIAESVNTIRAQIEDKIKQQSATFRDLIKVNENSDWIEPFLEFRSNYEFAPLAAEAMREFNQLRKQHEEPAEKIFNEARVLFRDQNANAGYDKYQEIVDNYYASSNYQRVKKWIADRKE